MTVCPFSYHYNQLISNQIHTGTVQTKLGLSTQVTMNAVYLTDATAREIKIGNRTIVFKRSAPRNFAYETDVFPLVVGAMKEIGEANVT